jgi:hypothetical protein
MDMPICLTMLGLSCSQPGGAKSHESLGQPFQLVRASIAEESTGSLTQAVPSPLPPSDTRSSPGSVPPEGTPCAALGLARRLRPCRPSHGGFQHHRLRHRRPLAPTPQNLGLALQAAAWVKAAGASQEPPCGGREGCGVREGPHGTLFAALTRTGTPVNAAVGGPVNALHGLPPPRAGLPGTFLPPMGLNLAKGVFPAK